MAGWDRYDVGWDPDHPDFSEMHPADDGRWVRFAQAEARLREVEAERDAAIEEGDRLKAAHRQAEQQLRSLLTDLQGEAGWIIDSGSWETPAAAAGRLEELIRKYAALSSTEQADSQDQGDKEAK